jgi:hypothetical protein
MNHLPLFCFACFLDDRSPHRSPGRHVLGVVASTIHIYSWVLFYAIEIHSFFGDVNKNLGGLTAMLVLGSACLYVLFPMLVLVFEARAAFRGTARHDYNKMLSETGSTSFARTPSGGPSGLKFGALCPNENSVFHRPKRPAFGERHSQRDRHYREESAMSETGTALSTGDYDSQHSFQQQLHRRRPSAGGSFDGSVAESMDGGDRYYSSGQDLSLPRPGRMNMNRHANLNYYGASGSSGASSAARLQRSAASFRSESIPLGIFLQMRNNPTNDSRGRPQQQQGMQAGAAESEQDFTTMAV